MRRIHIRIMSLLIMAILCMGLFVTTVVAQPSKMVEESTLKKVLKRGVLRVGVLTDGPPWGYLDENYEIVGFDVDIAKLMAENLGVKLKLVPTKNVNRVPFLVTGKVDVVIACFGNTLERAQSVAFSKPYAPYTLVLVGRKADKDLKSWKDTAGKRVAVGRGTTIDLIFTKIAPEGTEIVRYETPTDCFLALEQGKVDAVGEGYTICAYQVQLHPDWEIKGEPFARTFPCMGVPLGDQVWLNWVNLFIEHMLNERKIQELWVKHFEVPWTEIWPSY